MTRRRRFLGTLLLLLAGCGSRSGSSPSPNTRTTGSRGSNTLTKGSDSATSPSTSEHTARDEDGTSLDRASGSVTVVNDTDRDQFVTVAVDGEEDAVLVESRTVHQGTAVELDGRIPTGEYRVVVETASGIRDQFDWVVTPSLPTLRIRVSSGVRFARPALCDPDCRLARGGTSTGYPDGGFDPRGRRAGSELRVYNAGEREERVRIRIADGAVLDYRYQVSPFVLLTIPVPQRSGETAVRVDVAEGRVRAFDWAMETDPVRYVMLGR